MVTDSLASRLQKAIASQIAQNALIDIDYNSSKPNKNGIQNSDGSSDASDAKSSSIVSIDKDNDSARKTEGQGSGLLSIMKRNIQPKDLKKL